MTIGSLRCVVLDVTDLGVAEDFWSQVTGLAVIGSNYTGRFSYLGHKDPWKHEMILQLVSDAKREGSNRCHPDITVEDVDGAIEQIMALGGAIKKPPAPTCLWRRGSFLRATCLLVVETVTEGWIPQQALLPKLNQEHVPTRVEHESSKLEIGPGYSLFLQLRKVIGTRSYGDMSLKVAFDEN